MHRSFVLASFALALALPRLASAADGSAIIERRCIGCHGAKTRAAGLDLSTRDGALRGGKSGAALAAGAAEASLLFQRVSAGKMPPGAPLPPSEVASIKSWLEAGAAWNGVLVERRAGRDWWSLQPVRPSPLPDASGAPAAWRHSAVDRWIFSKLRSAGLAPSPEATREQLLRRVSFDLSGLPPTPEEARAFLADTRPDAYERLVDRLLASPRYGERWARHWLDVVRYAESEGFERDWLRESAWPYRDYVIESLNADLPYDVFAREQIAGDLIEPVTRKSIAATSFLVLGPTDAVGMTSAVAQERERVREDQLEEMVGAVSQTFLGMTVNCARCHDHKFDPIPQRDYYRLKASISGVWQPLDGEELKAGGRPLLTPSELDALQTRRAAIVARQTAAEDAMDALERKVRPRVAAEPPLPVTPSARWQLDTNGRDSAGGSHATLSEDSLLAGGALRPTGEKESVTIRTKALAFTVREKSLEAWVRVRAVPEKPVTLLRIRNQSGYRGAAQDGIQFAGGQKKQWENQSTVRFRSEDVDGPQEDSAPGGLCQIVITYAADDTIRLYRNGKPYGRAYKPDAAVAAGKLQTYGAGDALIDLGASKDLWLEEARVYTRTLTPEEVDALHARGIQNAPLETLEPAMDAAEREAHRGFRAQAAAAKAEFAAMPAPASAFAAVPKDPGVTHLLARGDVARKLEQVAPGAISALAGVPADFGLDPGAPDAQRRRKLAEWIASPANPLFIRTIVNRVWHYHFGSGFIENPNDLGYNGGAPAHPELLDWLATEFVRGGMRLKPLHKLIVLSAAYRQSSRFSADAAAKDADSRLLWRFPPRRLEGDAVRDAMLAASGRLNPAALGPSFQAFEIVKSPGSYHVYKPKDASDAALDRRTIYRMNVNSGGNPMLEALDCPLPSVKTPKRSVTTTPLQSLSLMNNPFVERQAAAFAATLRGESQDADSQVRSAFQRALGRAPRGEELASSLALIRSAGLETLCWGLFNSSEFLYVE